MDTCPEESPSMEINQQSQRVPTSASRASVKTREAVLIATNLGALLGFLYISRADPLKPLSTAIKVAHGAVKGMKFVRSLHSPTPLVFLFASKVLIKGYLISKRLKTPRNPTVVPGRLKAFVGSLNLVRYARVTRLGMGTEVMGFGLLRIGYKVSKNFAKVLEGFLGIRLDSAVKRGIDGLGLFVKSVSMTSEISRISKIARGMDCIRDPEVEDDTVIMCRFAGKLDPVSSVCLHRERVNSSRSSIECGRGGSFLVDFPGSSVQEVVHACVSDLLCLSIPIPSSFLITNQAVESETSHSFQTELARRFGGPPGPTCVGSHGPHMCRVPPGSTCAGSSGPACVGSSGPHVCRVLRPSVCGGPYLAHLEESIGGRGDICEIWRERVSDPML
ncbi:hypothetical protein H6P81_011878 [Aristolochia fimbriata]|uniref:Uncharacterized protein n=1 Tax=Aristolochia fimbriata TaxID=158543 RepID=A0AAV7ECD4_ARIFI|nr:hypothetical protein H6P81_011878 [Aristolochia fimbriata]